MRILVLGSSGSNIDLMEYCSQAHMEVHCISLRRNRFTDLHADHFVEHDYSDQAYVEGYCIRNGIELVCSMGSDVCMQISARVSQKLDLPSLITPETADLCVDKVRRREVLGAASPYNIRYKLIRGREDLDDWQLFPCILKPVDAQSQNGVFRADARADLERVYARSLAFSRSKRVIVEEYIAGRESTVSSYLCDSKVYFSIAYDKLPMKSRNNWSPQGYKIPSFYKKHERIRDLVESIVRATGIENGPLMVQIRYADGQPKIIEYFPRPGGSHTYRLIEKYCGVSLNETLIMHLKGQKLPQPQVAARGAGLVYRILYGRPGTAAKCAIDGLQGIKDSKQYFLENEIVLGKGDCERIGYYIQ